MKTDTRIGQRLWQAFLFQAVLISLAALLGVYGASFVLEDILIEQALEDEAEHFWSAYGTDRHFPRPDTYNLTGYLVPDDPFPDSFRDLSSGTHNIEGGESDFFIIHVSEKDGKRLYLEFDGKQVGDLALYYGMVPLAGVLIVIYLSSWISYRVSTRVISPIIKLAHDLEVLDPGSEEFSEKLKGALPRHSNQEVRTLSSALAHLSERIDAFVMRERNFTRDASHELRSPITVIKIAADLLLGDSALSAQNRKSVLRIKNNAADMEELIEALLILARESDAGLSFDSVCVNDVVNEEIERTESMFPGKPIKISFRSDAPLFVETSDKVLSVMIGNLIRNAYSYTDQGRVDISIEKAVLCIEDSGVGMADEEVKNIFKPFQRGEQRRRGGYGVGLTIVKMLSERFYWPMEITSEVDKGTRVVISFQERQEV